MPEKFDAVVIGSGQSGPWVDSNNPPVRACVQSPRLWRPGMLVEIMVAAAK